MPTSIGSGILVAPQQIYVDSSTPETTVGTRGETYDGRAFRYVVAGAVDLVPGTLVQGPATVTNHQNLTTAAAASGSTQVTVTLGNTAATANEYANGYLVLNTGTGSGRTYLISSHPAADALATLTLTLSDPLAAAIDGTTKSCLILNQYKGVVINPASPTATPVGVVVHAIPAGSAGWVLVHGPTSLLNDSNTAEGLGLAPSTSVAGAAITMAATLEQIGYTIEAGVDTEKRAAFITIE